VGKVVIWTRLKKVLCLFTVHCTCRHDWCSFEKFLLGKDNTSFNFTKTKQSSYYESIYFRIYVGFPHPGLNVSPNTFSLAARDRRE